MSWSGDWHIPQPRLHEATLRDALETACRAKGYRISYLVARDDKSTHAGIEIGALTGCLEWWANETTEAREDAWDREAIDKVIEGDDDELDGEGMFADDELVPHRFFGLGHPTLESVYVVGDGRGVLEIDRYRMRASVKRRIAPGELADEFADGTAGLSGIVGAHAFGGPALLYHGRQRLETGIDPALQIAAFHPRGVAITDDGTVWRVAEDGRATRIEAIPPTANGSGLWDAPWSIAERGDELWLANGSEHVYCLRGDEVRTIDRDGIERVVVASDQRIWLQDSSVLHVGDGEQFEPVELGVERRIGALAAGRAGRVVVFVPGPPQWQAESMSTEQAAAKMIVVDASGSRELLLAAKPISFKAAACTAGDLVWASTWDSVLAIEPGGPPHTRMTLRSNRDDNRDDAVWSAMFDLATRVAQALGGWDVTRP